MGDGWWVVGSKQAFSQTYICTYSFGSYTLCICMCNNNNGFRTFLYPSCRSACLLFGARLCAQLIIRAAAVLKLYVTFLLHSHQKQHKDVQFSSVQLSWCYRRGANQKSTNRPTQRTNLSANHAQPRRSSFGHIF